MDSPILDYNFIPEQQVKLFYWSGNSLELSHNLIVEIVKLLWIDSVKWYVVKAHKSILKNTTIEYVDIRENEFPNISMDYAVFMVDPDELEPVYMQLQLVTDNTI